ncbi:MAG: Ig-like domain-containing protein [Bryobacteraceae bacterium]
MPIAMLLLAVLGSFPRWDKIEVPFQGPANDAASLDVTFTAPRGEAFRVPGFHEGGTAWKVRFSADRNGAWIYRTESSEAELNGRTGSFTVVDPPSGTKGRLEYTGRRYLKFRDGGYWIKFGADEPENFLGKAFGLNDWNAKKRQIDYLAEKGINAVYIMTHNLEGDENDVWPWLGDTPEEAKRNHRRFNHDKLEKWRDFFEYIQSKGIVIQIVLEDDSAWTEYDHARYYREMIARFGYLPAIYFNFGEEHNENYSLAEALQHMKVFGDMDPYRHPRAIHNVNTPRPEYIDSPNVQLTSVQTNPSKPETLNQLAIDWWQAGLVRKQRPLVVSFDEARPSEDRRSWWAVYMAGGMWEPYVPVPQGYAALEPLWTELAAAGRFMETLAFEEMFPANHVVRKGRAFCLARPGETYALYLPSGGSVTVDLTAGNRYQVDWFDPRAGGWKQEPAVAGGTQTLAPPGSGDWALRLRRIQGDTNGPPVAASAKIFSLRDRPVPVHLAALGNGQHTYEIVTPPRHGKLEGAGADRTYAPTPGHIGQDRFEWRLRGKGWVSNTATVSVTANASGVNTPPRAEGLSITVDSGRAITFILRYTDLDGPGPYSVRIVKRPANGELQGMDNDITYTPAPGFRGADEIEWMVGDGETRSNRAKVRIMVN